MPVVPLALYQTYRRGTWMLGTASRRGQMWGDNISSP